jgi:CMP-N-acetylneuraminic acid synthetase
MRPDPDVVVANGAIYILWVGALMGGQDWYSGITYAYYMPKDRSLDIDTPTDLILARAMEEHKLVWKD